MKFEKQVLFLGITESRFSDGKMLYGVQLFEAGGEPVTVNVVRTETNEEMVDLLLGLEFGDKVNVIFRLRQTDKLYKLGLVHVSLC